MDKVIKRRGNSLVIIFDKEDIKLKNLAEGKIIRIDPIVIGELEAQPMKHETNLPERSNLLLGDSNPEAEKVKEEKSKRLHLD